MTILKSNPLLPLIAALIGFFLMESGISLGKKPDKVTESKVDQSPKDEESKTTTIELLDVVWFGNIGKNETKQLELNLLFPDEGKFFLEATALAYDKQPKVWKTLGKYLVDVTIKKGEEGKIEKARTRPKVTGQKVKAEGPVITNWYETAKRDTSQDKSTGEKPRVIPSPVGGPLPLHVSRQQGEALIDLLISFEPKPKVNEPTKLLLSVLSPVPRDSVVVYLFYTGSIKIIK